MNMLMERGEKEGKPRVHAFNTFFYPKIINGGHSSVRRWTKRVDVFAMDYILVPVHLGMHWCLAVSFEIINVGHSSVRRWTKRVDVFAMDYILVPVHLGMHWCLAVSLKNKTVVDESNMPHTLWKGQGECIEIYEWNMNSRTIASKIWKIKDWWYSVFS